MVRLRAAATMYSKALVRALKTRYPSWKGEWRVMEDNDPTDYKSSAAVSAKSAANIRVVEMPPRSPDLNPLDYSVWSEINRKMHPQEARWPKSKKEARKAFLARLRRTAMSLSADYINKVFGNLESRLKLLKKAKGRHFVEGGHSIAAAQVIPPFAPLVNMRTACACLFLRFTFKHILSFVLQI